VISTEKYCKSSKAYALFRTYNPTNFSANIFGHFTKQAKSSVDVNVRFVGEADINEKLFSI